ncbi:MAG: ThiF family adenylyltransferase [Bacilli bacterium]
MERYRKQSNLAFIGQSGQEKIMQAKIAIIGCGALGTHAAEYLVRMGVQHLVLVDRDYIEQSNLQRQTLFTEQDYLTESPKAEVVQQALLKINSNLTLESIVAHADAQLLAKIAQNVDILVDATDNFSTRFLLNDVAYRYSKPWVYAGVIGTKGVSVPFIPNQTPCWHCLFEQLPIENETCDSIGVFTPSVMHVSASQIQNVIKIILTPPEEIDQVIWSYDSWNQKLHTLSIPKNWRNEGCATCGNEATYPFFTNDKLLKYEKLCGREAMMIRTPFSLEAVHKTLNQNKEVEVLNTNTMLCSYRYKNFRIIYFRDRRCILHGVGTEIEAKQIIHDLLGE